MADDRHYVPGDYYRIDDRTGFKVRAARTRKEWNGLIVRTRSWEPRQPQDLVRGVRDNQTVPEARPRSPDVFIGVKTTLTAAINIEGGFSTGFSRGFQRVGIDDDQVLPVASVADFTVGNFISILLDDGNVWTTTLVAIDPVVITLTIAQGVPSPASIGNFVFDAAFNAVSASSFPGLQ
jgi:hypothetical protein